MKKILSSTPILAIMCCLLWSIIFVPTKVGLTYFEYPFQYAGYTHLIAGLLLLPWGGFGCEYIKHVKENIWLVLKVAFFSTTLLYGAYYLGQSLIAPSLAALIVSAQPFFVFVMAHFMMKNERFTPMKVLSVILAVIGVVIVSYPSVRDIHVAGLSAVVGIAMVLVNCVSASYANITVSKVDFTRVKSRVLTSSQLTIGGFMLFIISIAVDGGVKPLPISNVQFLVATIAVVAFTVIAIMTWYSLLAREEVKVSELNMWKFIMPIFGTFISWAMIESDKPNVYSVTGVVVLTISLVLFYRSPLIGFFSRMFKKEKKESVEK